MLRHELDNNLWRSSVTNKVTRQLLAKYLRKWPTTLWRRRERIAHVDNHYIWNEIRTISVFCEAWHHIRKPKIIVWNSYTCRMLCENSDSTTKHFWIKNHGNVCGPFWSNYKCWTEGTKQLMTNLWAWNHPRKILDKTRNPYHDVECYENFNCKVDNRPQRTFTWTLPSRLDGQTQVNSETHKRVLAKGVCAEIRRFLSHCFWRTICSPQCAH